MERLQLWGRGKSNGRVRTWDHPTTTLLQIFSYQELHTVGLELALNYSKPDPWESGLCSPGTRGGVASTPLSHKCCTSRPGRNRVTWSPQALRQQASSPVPSPHVTRPRRGGASPVLSTQTCHVMGAVLRPESNGPAGRRPTSSSQPQYRKVDPAKAGAPVQEERP